MFKKIAGSTKDDPGPPESKMQKTTEQAASNTDHNNNSQNTPPSKPDKRTSKKPKNWQESWLQEFSWLRKDDTNLMFCMFCEKHSGASNTFVSGCKNYQHSTLVRHMELKDHIKAKQAMKEKEYMVAAKKCIKEKTLPVLEAQIRTALFIAENNLSNRRYLNLIDLQLANGASVFSSKGIYTNNQAASSFQKYIANVLVDTVVVRLKNSPFIGIMLDESLDIAVNKKLVLF